MLLLFCINSIKCAIDLTNRLSRECLSRPDPELAYDRLRISMQRDGIQVRTNL